MNYNNGMEHLVLLCIGGRIALLLGTVFATSQWVYNDKSFFYISPQCVITKICLSGHGPVPSELNDSNQCLYSYAFHTRPSRIPVGNNHPVKISLLQIPFFSTVLKAFVDMSQNVIMAINFNPVIQIRSEFF